MRLWYYFRIGYGTYLTFLLGAINTLVVVWYLAIGQSPEIQNLFGHFMYFAVVATLLGTPLSVLIGWIHLKRSPAYRSEMDVGAEANPYNYKLLPGFTREVYAPMFLELLVQLAKLLDTQRLLTPEEKTRIETIARKLQTLIDGGVVGTPRATM
jgi:hypothetical protein